MPFVDRGLRSLAVPTNRGHLACTKPKELGYAAELWTRKALSVHVRQHAQAAGHPSLVQAAKATVQRILDEPQL
jgi:hypothetical protein